MIHPSPPKVNGARAEIHVGSSLHPKQIRRPSPSAIHSSSQFPPKVRSFPAKYPSETKFRRSRPPARRRSGEVAPELGPAGARTWRVRVHRLVGRDLAGTTDQRRFPEGGKRLTGPVRRATFETATRRPSPSVHLASSSIQRLVHAVVLRSAINRTPLRRSRALPSSHDASRAEHSKAERSPPAG